MKESFETLVLSLVNLFLAPIQLCFSCVLVLYSFYKEYVKFGNGEENKKRYEDEIKSILITG
eukprot:Pgem_evm1s4543